MASRRPETITKRLREQAVREKRERKQAKKDARVQLAADIAAGIVAPPEPEDLTELGSADDPSELDTPA